jgi:hypothetical protein
MSNEAITGMIVVNGKLVIMKGSSAFQTESNGREPNEWTYQKLAGLGTSEPFVQHLTEEVFEYIDGSSIYEPERQQFKDAVANIVFDGLMPAFEHLKRIRASVSQEMPIVNRRQLYEDFTSQLWRTYKGQFQSATKLLGIDIGFNFGDEKQFSDGAAKFKAKHPNLMYDVSGLLQSHRHLWQNELSKFRNNFIEHPKSKRDDFEKFYSREHAEFLFEMVWMTMAMLLPVLIAEHFRGMISIQAVPPSERDTRRPRFFQFVMMRAIQPNADK